MNKREEIADNYELPEPDDDFGDDYAPDYYLCNSCGYNCVENHGGWGCPRCTALMEPQYY